ncbi:MAG: type VI secretion system tip protein VgrG [Bacteroidia bacterium]|nr:type VI secretion system tip protein VgrG [Bacteroidia bacterium]
MRILLEGQDITLKYGIVSVFTSNQVNRIPQATLVLHDGSASKQNFELSATDEFIPGKKVTIKLGYKQREQTVFEGIIIKHSIKAPLKGNSTLVLELRDESVKTTLVRKNKLFSNTSDSQIITDLAKAAGLKVIPPLDTPVLHKEMVQYYSTDWDFILSRAEANGWLVITQNGKLTVGAPQWAKAALPKLNLAYGDNIVDFEADIDARDQVKSVKAKSWSTAEQKVQEKDGRAKIPAEQGNLNSSQLADVCGAEIELQHPGKRGKQELQAWADAKLLRSRLAKVCGRVRIYGTSAIETGDFILLAGLGKRFNGPAFVSGVVHSFTAGGTWVTDIQFGYSQEAFAERYATINDKPSAGLLPSVNGLLTGIVTKIENDPDGEFRVQLRIPVMSSTGEIWARIARADGGNGRGMIFRPEVNDEVIVGFINDDPRDPVVLGMLHSSKLAPPSDFSHSDAQNKLKGIVTKSKIKLLFDDEKKSVTVTTPGKNSIEISDDEKSITLKDQHGNKIVMDKNGITMESSKDFTVKAKGNIKAEGTNIEQKAKTKYAAEGSSTAELKSSGQTVIKGGVVNIN